MTVELTKCLRIPQTDVEMHPRYWLTWKRGDQLIPRWVIVTFPLVVGLLGVSLITIPLPWTNTFPVATFVVSVILSLFLYFWVYRFTKSAGEVLYYPPLHTRRWLIVSTAAIAFLGITVTYLSYLVFIVPQNKPALPPLPDLGIGLVLASGYALFLSGWKTRVIRKDKDPVSETEAAESIQEALHQLRGDVPHFDDTEQLIEGLEMLADHYDCEPLMEPSLMPDDVRTWCKSCAESNSLASRLRMLPNTDKEATTERTERQISRFRELENDLHTLDIIALSRNSKHGCQQFSRLFRH